MPLRHLYLPFQRFRAAPTAATGAVDRLMQGNQVPVERVRICYRATTDTAVLELRLRIESVWDLADVVVWAQGEGVHIIDPATLSEDRRAQLKVSYAVEFGRLPGTFVDPRLALRRLAAYLGLPACPALARGTVAEPRPVAMEWRAPRLNVVDRTRPDRGSRTASGVIGDRSAFMRAGSFSR